MILPYLGIISSLAAAAGLFFVAVTFRKDVKTRQLQKASELIRDLQDLEEDIKDISKIET